MVCVPFAAPAGYYLWGSPNHSGDAQAVQASANCGPVSTASERLDRGSEVSPRTRSRRRGRRERGARTGPGATRCSARRIRPSRRAARSRARPRGRTPSPRLRTRRSGPWPSTRPRRDRARHRSGPCRRPRRCSRARSAARAVSRRRSGPAAGRARFLRRRAPRWPADRSRAALPLTAVAQKLDHAVTEVLILAAAAIPEGKDGDGRRGGHGRRPGGRRPEAPGGPDANQKERRAQGDDGPPAAARDSTDSALQRCRNGHDLRERLADVRCGKVSKQVYGAPVSRRGFRESLLARFRVANGRDFEIRFGSPFGWRNDGRYVVTPTAAPVSISSITTPQDIVRPSDGSPRTCRRHVRRRSVFIALVILPLGHMARPKSRILTALFRELDVSGLSRDDYPRAAPRQALATFAPIERLPRPHGPRDPRASVSLA